MDNIHIRAAFDAPKIARLMERYGITELQARRRLASLRQIGSRNAAR